MRTITRVSNLMLICLILLVASGTPAVRAAPRSLDVSPASALPTVCSAELDVIGTVCKVVGYIKTAAIVFAVLGVSLLGLTMLAPQGVQSLLQQFQIGVQGDYLFKLIGGAALLLGASSLVTLIFGSSVCS